MKIYRISKHYSVMRDDDELRVVICPKCRKSNIEKFKKRVLMTLESDCTSLFQCKNCKSYFTFYTEDGLRDISEKEAKQGIKEGYQDLQDNGMDQHEHSYYVLFKDEPPTIGDTAYWNKFEGDYEEYRKWKDALPSVNSLVRNKDAIMSIDFKYTGEK